MGRGPYNWYGFLAHLVESDFQGVAGKESETGI